MNESTHALRVERTFQAAPEAIFQAWTTSELLKQWLHPADDWSTPVAECDLRVGGAYRWGVRSPTGGIFYEVGTFEEIRPPRRLVYTCRYESDEFDQPMPSEEMLVIVELEELTPGTTRVTVVQKGYLRAEDRDEQQGGWPSFLEMLAKLVEAA